MSDLSARMRVAGSADDDGSVRLYRQPLIRYFIRKGATETVAEDLAQDCFTRLFALSSRDHIENVEAYLFRTAATVFADHLEHAHRRRTAKHVPLDPDDFDAPPTEAPGQDRVLEGKEGVQRLRIVLLELKPRTREIFLLNRFDGLSYTQIAVRFGLTNRGVEFHMSEALKHLRHRLGEWRSQ